MAQLNQLNRDGEGLTGGLPTAALVPVLDISNVCVMLALAPGSP